MVRHLEISKPDKRKQTKRKTDHDGGAKNHINWHEEGKEKKASEAIFPVLEKASVSKAHLLSVIVKWKMKV